jgi:ABC-2 type transport system ATP-binding protein
METGSNTLTATDGSVSTPASVPSPVITLQNLTVELGGRIVLNDVTCSFGKRTIGLLGPNGAGKSTLINTVLGFWKPLRGSARIFGFDVATEGKRIREVVGYMPENDAFISEMSAVSFIRLMAELSGLPSRAALERAHEALFYVGLGEARYRKLGSYSLGMKQLAKLAQAIVHGPQLLILDEPTNGLDPPARARMIRLVKEMRDSKTMHIILCSHLLRDVEEICDEVIILKAGRVVHFSDLDAERQSETHLLELELVGDSAAFLADAERLGCTIATGVANRLKLVLADGLEITDIYRIADKHQVQLRRASFRRNTLEDIFLKAMEKNNGGL